MYYWEILSNPNTPLSFKLGSNDKYIILEIDKDDISEFIWIPLDYTLNYMLIVLSQTIIKYNLDFGSVIFDKLVYWAIQILTAMHTLWM